MDPFIEAYRSLRSSLIYMGETGKRPHTLLVTSSVPNDGKSLTAANLAITLAMSGSRVLLVDADLRRGNLRTRFNVTADAGMTEVLSEGADWHGLVKETPVKNLWLLPRGKPTQRSGEYFIGETIKKFLETTVKEYDYVLIDTPPVMAVDDVACLAPQVDAVIFVVRARRTSARVAHASLDMLYQRKAQVMGLVFNCVEVHAMDYYYYSGYKQYHKT
jgi:capsular exopolysaccharide synthesis family protein